jgi:hypothetical protein
MTRGALRRTAAFVAATLMTGIAAAQTRATTADLAGTVFDQSRAVIVEATITATNVETNQSRATRTDEAGRFLIPALPPGRYRVSAERAGFSSQTDENVVLQLGGLVGIDFTLAVSSFAESVTVSPAVPVLDRAQTSIAMVIAQPQISNLPINGRDFLSFAVIAPAVTRDNTPQQGATATSGLSFAGQRARSNNITVDGLDNNDSTVGSVRATFSQEAVREFQVVANSYSAEFGKASGGIVNIVTKSGTNRAAGTAFWFFRDAALNAKEYFERFAPSGEAIDRGKAPFSQQQFGITYGGPLRRDKTFFFGSFERLDISTNNFVTIDESAAAVLRGAGFVVETGNVPYVVTSNQALVKIDHQLAPAQQLAVRYNYAGGVNENTETWGGLVARSRGAALDNTDHMLVASHTSVPSSAVVNELRGQFARRDQELYSLDPNCGGRCTGEDQGGPTLEVLGVASVGRQRFTPQPRLTDRYQLLETVSMLRGDHQWKAGVDFNIVDHRMQALPLHFGGRYLFQPLPAIPGLLPTPVTALQALAAGLPAAYVQGYGRSSTAYSTRDISLFAQDEWRAGAGLTVRAGVRYERQFWPDIQFVTPGVATAYTFPPDSNNVGPRLAISWNPSGSPRTVVHAGYGIYYDAIITGIPAITDIVDGSGGGVRTLVARFPNTLAAWNASGHRLPEPAAGTYPSLVIAVDPGMKTAYAHHISAGVDEVVVSASVVQARGFNQPGTIDYNPLVPALGAGRRPLDAGGIPGTSASVLQYTSFGESWYNGLSVSARKRFSGRTQFLASYTLSKAEDTSTDFQTAFIPQSNGRGRDPNDPTGLPLGFDPRAERGPSLQDQRHRLVLSGVYVAPLEISLSSIVTIASGRPYNILAGTDLNGDGDGGTIPGSDRPRTNPADPATSIGRNAGLLPAQATVDLRVNKRFAFNDRRSVEVIADVFNLFNRANFTDLNPIFGTGSYPAQPLPTYGQFQKAAAPRQVQLAARLNF